MNPETALLEVREVSKAFGGIQALFGVSFKLNRGEILGIIGPNGSGKTTLINCITGFVRTDSGKVFFKGREITNWAPHKIADLGVTRTFQIMRPYYSLPAYKNLIVPLFPPGPDARAAGEGAENWGTGTRSGSTSWRKSVLRGIRRCPTSWPRPCPPGT